MPIHAERPADTLPLAVYQSWLAQPGWMTDAACQYTDPDLFFPESDYDDRADARHGPTSQLRFNQAKWVCRRCPVLEQCREFILKTENPLERWGIWGGMTTKERDAESKKRAASEAA